MADEVDDMNIDISLGASIHMEELKSILEQIVSTFRELAKGTAENFNHAVSGISKSSRELVNAGKDVAESLEKASLNVKKEFNSMFSDVTKLLNRPLDSIEKMLTSGIKDIGLGLTDMLSPDKMLASQRGLAVAEMGQAGMLGAEAIGGAGAAAGGATAVTGGAALPILAALAVIVVALAVLTKIVEIGFDMLGKMFSAFMEPINQTLGVIATILSVPMKLLGSVFAEMMIPFLDLFMQLGRVFLPLIMQFRDDYRNIYSSLIEEGAGQYEAAMGASTGALSGFVMSLFEPVMVALNSIGNTITYTIGWYLLSGIELLGNTFISLLDPLNLLGLQFNLVNEDLDTFVNDGVKKGTEAFKDVYSQLRTFVMDISTLWGREKGKVLDDLSGQTQVEDEQKYIDALENTNQAVTDNTLAVEKLTKKYSDSISVDLYDNQGKLISKGSYSESSEKTTEKHNVDLSGTVKISGSELFMKEISDIVLTKSVEAIVKTQKTYSGRMDIAGYPVIQFSMSG